MTRSMHSPARRGLAVEHRLLRPLLIAVVASTLFAAVGSPIFASNVWLTGSAAGISHQTTHADQRLSSPTDPGRGASATGCSDSPATRLKFFGPGAEPVSTHVTLRLNLPAFRLDVLSGTVVVRSHSVTVGVPQHETPVGQFEIIRIVWNPWWNPAESEWARDKQGMPPGPRNPLGKVMLLVRGPAYLHGTPARTSLGLASSHGGVGLRNESAIDVARLVQACAGVAITTASTDSLASELYETRVIDLPKSVSISIVYELVEVGSQTVTVYPDVYGRAPGSLRSEAFAALTNAGYDTTRVDRAVVDAVLERAKAHPASVAVSKLLRPTPVTPR